MAQSKKDKAHVFKFYWLAIGDNQYSLSEELTGIVPGRRYRVDFAFEEQRLAIEVDGGVYGFSFYNKKTGQHERRRGGHSSVTGQLRDMERSNLLTLHGWRILRFTPKQLEQDPHVCIELVIKTLEMIEIEKEGTQ